MLSLADSLIHLDEELPGGQQWAQRHAVPLVWLPGELELRATLTQLVTSEEFYLRGRFDNYRAIAPAWVFTDATWTAAPSSKHFPKPLPTSPYGSSVFHTLPVICAPFNRLAYKEHAGPHSDWGGPQSWLTAGLPTEVKAHCMADMLSVIHGHFRYTQGRMG